MNKGTCDHISHQLDKINTALMKIDHDNQLDADIGLDRSQSTKNWEIYCILERTRDLLNTLSLEVSKDAVENHARFVKIEQAIKGKAASETEDKYKSPSYKLNRITKIALQRFGENEDLDKSYIHSQIGKLIRDGFSLDNIEVSAKTSSSLKEFMDCVLEIHKA